MQETSTYMDKAAIGLSLVCIIHCLVVPIAIVMLPALGATFLEDEKFHFAILFLVIPTSLFALGLGCKKHGRKEILGIGLVGLFVLCLVVIIGEETLGEFGEKLSTIIGASIVALAHVRNFNQCRSLACNEDSHSEKTSSYNS